METVLDILTGIGLALAAGIRPFLPGLAAGAFGAANLTIDFERSDLSFLESPAWLVAMAVLLVVFVLVRRQLGAEVVEQGPGRIAFAAIAAAIGALLFAGALADHS